MDMCVVCSKSIKKKVYRCDKCGLPVCRGCSIGRICKDCVVASDSSMVFEYFKDKYMNGDDVLCVQ